MAHQKNNVKNINDQLPNFRNSGLTYSVISKSKSVLNSSPSLFSHWKKNKRKVCWKKKKDSNINNN